MGWETSAEYPGVACDLLDERLGMPVSMFLQGAGADAKPRVIADGDAWRTASSTWADVQAAGQIAAGEVEAVLKGAMTPVKPGLSSSLAEMQWPLESPPPREQLEALRGHDDRGRRILTQNSIDRLDRGLPLATFAPILIQAFRLGDALRIVALEGEPAAGVGQQVLEASGAGVTFALGYSNGMGLYLPAESMLSEGGYEVDSFWEYGLPRSSEARVPGDTPAGPARFPADRSPVAASACFAGEELRDHYRTAAADTNAYCTSSPSSSGRITIPRSGTSSCQSPAPPVNAQSPAASPPMRRPKSNSNDSAARNGLNLRYRMDGVNVLWNSSSK